MEGKPPHALSVPRSSSAASRATAKSASLLPGLEPEEQGGHRDLILSPYPCSIHSLFGPGGLPLWPVALRSSSILLISSQPTSGVFERKIRKTMKISKQWYFYPSYASIVNAKAVCRSGQKEESLKKDWPGITSVLKKKLQRCWRIGLIDHIN